MFKYIFRQPENAVAHFRSFLPVAIADALDFSKAKLDPGSFVDENLKERHLELP